MTSCSLCGRDIRADEVRSCTVAAYGHPDQYEELTCCPECAGEE